MPDEAELLAQPALDEALVAGVRAEPLVNSTKVGGPAAGLGGEQDPRLLAAAHRVRVAATSPPRNALSRPVEIRVSQPASAASSAGTSRSTCRPVRAEMLTRGAHGNRTRSRSISRSR